MQDRQYPSLMVTHFSSNVASLDVRLCNSVANTDTERAQLGWNSCTQLCSGRHSFVWLCYTHHACNNTFCARLSTVHTVGANLVWVDKKPPTAPALMPAGDIFCSLLFDHPGHSAKLGTLSFTSTANNLRNTPEVEQSTNLYDNKRRLNILGSYNPVQVV